MVSEKYDDVIVLEKLTVEKEALLHIVCYIHIPTAFTP